MKLVSRSLALVATIAVLGEDAAVGYKTLSTQRIQHEVDYVVLSCTNPVFLQECNDGCSCKWSCGNKVVERGLSIPFQVFWTGSKGWGLRATSPIQKGNFVFEYAGEIDTNVELMQRRATAKLGKSKAFTLALDADWKPEQVVNDDVALCIDGTNLSNVSTFVNHRCEDANLIDVPVRVSSNHGGVYHVAYFAQVNIPAIEELMWDYGCSFQRPKVNAVDVVFLSIVSVVALTAVTL